MEQLIQSMRETLGTAFALYVMTHGVHWNVEGPDFYQLHKLLDDQYREIWDSLDEIAEHLRAMDAYAPQSMDRFLELSRVPSASPAPFIAREMLIQLMKGHETMIALLSEALHLAEEADNQGLVNFLGARIEAHQKHRWMLRASAKPQVTKA
jgi:starvation-inducible DNA-binding protein